MEDKEILELFRRRSEKAIASASDKYKSYCMKIAVNILGTRQDAEECVNDTFFKAWELIPPNEPQMLSTFLGKLTRNLAINTRRRAFALKSGEDRQTRCSRIFPNLFPAIRTYRRSRSERSLSVK